MRTVKKFFVMAVVFLIVTMFALEAKAEKKGEKTILDEILSMANGKTLRGIIDFRPMLTDHVEPPLSKHPFE